jgi:acetyl esterase/lipase
VFQALLYPSTDVSRTDSPSYRQYGQGYWLTTRAVETFRSFYLPDPNWWRHPDASRLLAPDADLRLLPRTLVMAAGCDVLRDEVNCLGVADELEGEFPRMVLRDLLAYGWDLWDLLDDHARTETRAVQRYLAQTFDDDTATAQA